MMYSELISNFLFLGLAVAAALSLDESLIAPHAKLSIASPNVKFLIGFLVFGVMMMLLN